jgi:hypothetical protein
MIALCLDNKFASHSNQRRRLKSPTCSSFQICVRFLAKYRPLFGLHRVCSANVNTKPSQSWSNIQLLTLSTVVDIEYCSQSFNDDMNKVTAVAKLTSLNLTHAMKEAQESTDGFPFENADVLSFKDKTVLELGSGTGTNFVLISLYFPCLIIDSSHKRDLWDCLSTIYRFNCVFENSDSFFFSKNKK